MGAVAFDTLKLAQRLASLAGNAAGGCGSTTRSTPGNLNAKQS
jgi:hypothetical protein